MERKTAWKSIPVRKRWTDRLFLSFLILHLISHNTSLYSWTKNENREFEKDAINMKMKGKSCVLWIYYHFPIWRTQDFLLRIGLLETKRSFTGVLISKSHKLILISKEYKFVILVFSVFLFSISGITWNNRNPSVSYLFYY